MRSKSYVIELPPLAWKRCDRNGLRFFDGQKKEKLIFGLSMRKYHNNEPPFITATRLDVFWFVAIPKSRNNLKEGDYCDKKLDIDNLEKFILDTAKDAEILSDDKIICEVFKRKVWSRHPRTEFTLTQLV